jgi:hypothetical protein
MTVTVIGNKADRITTGTIEMNSKRRVEFLGAGKCAFIGRLNAQQPRELYLVTFTSIVQANNFRATWSGNPTFIVEEWVDITIYINGQFYDTDNR